jgi:hypothetical protein
MRRLVLVAGQQDARALQVISAVKLKLCGYSFAFLMLILRILAEVFDQRTNSSLVLIRHNWLARRLNLDRHVLDTIKS